MSGSIKEAISDVQAEHWLKPNSLNLGQYKSEYTCACGQKLIEDGHSQGRPNNITLLLHDHISESILPLIEAYTEDRVVAELEKLSDKADTHETPIYGVTNRQIHEAIEQLNPKGTGGAEYNFEEFIRPMKKKRTKEYMSGYQAGYYATHYKRSLKEK